MPVASVLNAVSKRRPKIVIDSREPKKFLAALKPLCEKDGIILEKAALEVGDFEITDADGNVWCIERKSMSDCFNSIITKTTDGSTGRIYDQLARLIGKYGDRAVLLLENPFYVSKRIPVPKYKIIQAVFTFVSERSFVMPTVVTRDANHTVFLLVKLAKRLNKMEFRGRDVTIARR